VVLISNKCSKIKTKTKPQLKKDVKILLFLFLLISVAFRSGSRIKFDRKYGIDLDRFQTKNTSRTSVIRDNQFFRGRWKLKTEYIYLH